jgi:hypothetical protein
MVMNRINDRGDAANKAAEDVSLPVPLAKLSPTKPSPTKCAKRRP